MVPFLLVVKPINSNMDGLKKNIGTSTFDRSEIRPYPMQGFNLGPSLGNNSGLGLASWVLYMRT